MAFQKTALDIMQLLNTEHVTFAETNSPRLHEVVYQDLKVLVRGYIGYFDWKYKFLEVELKFKEEGSQPSTIDVASDHRFGMQPKNNDNATVVYYAEIIEEPNQFALVRYERPGIWSDYIAMRADEVRARILEANKLHRHPIDDSGFFAEFNDKIKPLK